MKHLSQKRRALPCLASDHMSDFVPVPRQEIAACLFGAQASFRVCLVAKRDHERFRFGGNREPQFVRALMIGHRTKLPFRSTDMSKHNGSRPAVSAITARDKRRCLCRRPLQPHVAVTLRLRHRACHNELRGVVLMGKSHAISNIGRSRALPHPCRCLCSPRRPRPTASSLTASMA